MVSSSSDDAVRGEGERARTWDRSSSVFCKCDSFREWRRDSSCCITVPRPNSGRIDTLTRPAEPPPAPWRSLSHVVWPSVPKSQFLASSTVHSPTSRSESVGEAELIKTLSCMSSPRSSASPRSWSGKDTRVPKNLIWSIPSESWLSITRVTVPTTPIQ